MLSSGNGALLLSILCDFGSGKKMPRRLYGSRDCQTLVSLGEESDADSQPHSLQYDLRSLPTSQQFQYIVSILYRNSFVTSSRPHLGAHQRPCWRAPSPNLPPLISSLVTMKPVVSALNAWSWYVPSCGLPLDQNSKLISHLS